jgi:hypothetical protein
VAAVWGLFTSLRRAITFAGSYRYAFTENTPFFRSLEQLEAPVAERIVAALAGENMIYAMPAVAGHDIPGFKGSVGFLVLSPTRLIFTPKEGKTVKSAAFPLDSFPDANVKDGKKNIELKLIQPNAKPTFQLLGVSRDHAQELFMKMHALRQQPRG